MTFASQPTYHWLFDLLLDEIWTFCVQLFRLIQRYLLVYLLRFCCLTRAFTSLLVTFHHRLNITHNLPLPLSHCQLVYIVFFHCRLHHFTGLFANHRRNLGLCSFTLGSPFMDYFFLTLLLCTLFSGPPSRISRPLPIACLPDMDHWWPILLGYSPSFSVSHLFSFMAHQCAPHSSLHLEFIRRLLPSAHPKSIRLTTTTITQWNVYQRPGSHNRTPSN